MKLSGQTQATHYAGEHADTLDRLSANAPAESVEMYLEIDKSVFDETSVRALVEQWLVPAIVDNIVNSLLGCEEKR